MASAATAVMLHDRFRKTLDEKILSHLARDMNAAGFISFSTKADRQTFGGAGWEYLSAIPSISFTGPNAVRPIKGTRKRIKVLGKNGGTYTDSTFAPVKSLKFYFSEN